MSSVARPLRISVEDPKIYFTSFLKLLPGTNLGTFLAGIWIVYPVWEFLPHEFKFYV